MRICFFFERLSVTHDTWDITFAIGLLFRVKRTFLRYSRVTLFFFVILEWRVAGFPRCCHSWKQSKTNMEWKICKEQLLRHFLQHCNKASINFFSLSWTFLSLCQICHTSSLFVNRDNFFFSYLSWPFWVFYSISYYQVILDSNLTVSLVSRQFLSFIKLILLHPLFLFLLFFLLSCCTVLAVVADF